jgi:hypothetical protein
VTSRPSDPPHPPRGVEDREAVVLTPSLGNGTFLFLVSLASVVGFGLVGFTDRGFPARLAIVAVPFFAFATVSAGSLFIPGANYLSIDRDGFTLSRMWRVKRYRWIDIEEPLRLWNQKFNSNTLHTYILFVVSDNRGPEAFVNGLIGIRGRSLAHLYKEMSADALVTLMNEKRAHALGRDRQGAEAAGIEVTDAGELGAKTKGNLN